MPPSHAQQLRFDHISIAEGLSSNSVYTVFQDSDGILWMGTLDGLNRYDGYGITVYKHDQLKKSSLSNNRITLIYEDRQHNLWLYDEFTSIMIRYFPAKDEFKTYPLDKTAGTELEIVDFIREDQDGTIYVRSHLGYTLRYNPAADTFNMVSSSDALPPNSSPGDQQPLLAAFDTYLLNANSTFDTNTIGIRKTLRDSEGRYWIGTKYDGLYTATLEHNNFVFTSHFHTPDKFKKINSEEIHDIYEDRSNVVWIGTKNNGLYRYTRYKYKFDHIESIEAGAGSFPLGTLRAITQDASRNTWIGTNDQGLIRIDPTGKTGKIYKPEPGKPSGIAHRFIRSLLVDAGQHLWVGYYNGFSRYRPATDDFIPYYPKSENEEEIRVYDLKAAQDKSLWMAAWDIIIHFDPATNRYEFISRQTSKHPGFSIENIRDLELDDAGALWIAVGEKGIAIFNKAENTFTTLRYSTDPASLPSNNIFDIFKDSRNNLWLATADGLCHFDPVKKTCETYTVNDGLPSNLVYGIMEDRHGHLWFSSTKGIGRFDPLKKTFRNYDVTDGLQSNEFTENAFFQNSDGQMFFGGINGLNIFHPDHVPDNPHPPQVIITGIRAFDKPLSEVRLFRTEVIKQKQHNNEEIAFTSEQRSISFEFAALHYVNPQKNKYACMLEGFDKQWTYRDANTRFANYTNLEPGTYYFKVKASNSDGVWSAPVSLKITIGKPFYATWWFISVCALMLLTACFFAYRWQIAAVKKQQSMKSIQLESELNFLKSQVNPHFLFNTLNNIYALCQVNSRNAAPMVGKISEMMRYMIYDCNANLVPLQKEIEYLQNYIDLNQLKSPRKLNAAIVVHGNPNGLKIAPLLLINFLENCFKHGDVNLNGRGFVQATFTITGTELLLVIKNSFRDKAPVSQEQQGIGLENARHRLSLLYAERHTLRIGKNNGIFEIELKLHLD